MTARTFSQTRNYWVAGALGFALATALVLPAGAAPPPVRPVAFPVSGPSVPASHEIEMDEPDEFEAPEYEEPGYEEPEYEKPEYHEEESSDEFEGGDVEMEEFSFEDDSEDSHEDGEHEEDGHDEDEHDEDGGDDGDDHEESSDDHHGDDHDDDLEFGFDSDHDIELTDDLTEEFDEHGYAAVATEFLILVDETREALPDLGASRVEEAYRLDGLEMSLYRVQVSGEGDIAEIALELSDYGDDAAADYNHIYETESGGAGATAAGCKPLDCARAMHWPGDSGAGLRLGLIDTAIDRGHPALAGAQIETQSFLVSDALAPMDHGTAVASLLVGRDGTAFEGLTPDATLFAASVFTSGNEGQRFATTESLIRALDWCLAQDATSINMSLAGPPNRLLEFAIRRARDLDRHVIAAVGNAGPAAPPLFPAAYGGVTAVTAVDGAGRVYRRANRGDHVDFSAPGVDVLAATPGGGYATVSGTSFAAPFVTALIAAREATQTSSADVEAEMRRGAIDLGREGFDPVYGYGLAQWFEERPAYVQ